MITNQVYNSGKYSKSLEENMERAFTNVTKMAKITITAEITNETTHGSNNGKYNKSLKERREGGAS